MPGREVDNKRPCKKGQRVGFATDALPPFQQSNQELDGAHDWTMHFTIRPIIYHKQN
jgi:hypothetical protein